MPQQRVVLKHCGVIDPDDIASYLAQDGFQALQKALQMPPEGIIEEIKASGLRGRGGAGFPTGLKWEMTRKTPADERYILGNADEGEVGTFKDRYILENDPFSLVEAMAIAGRAIGAKKGYIYLRGEYHRLLGRLRGAIRQAREKGFLAHIDLEVREGAGAYVCGEESALMNSIEGQRGEVRYRPPFPPSSGLWARPTVINNIETLMNVPRIILGGAAWFSQMGTERSKGTKVFSVAGDVKHPGVYEMVMGSPLRELVEGLAGAEAVKMMQIGGATGRIIPYDQIDAPLAFESLLGAGAVTVYHQDRDVVEIIFRTMAFLAEESCGKCTPCREGTEVMLGILRKFLHGEAAATDIGLLEELADTMILTSLCGLGQAAPNPVLDSLKYFREAYQGGIKAKNGVATC
ncbi:MAG: NADH-ubiquinone oxidoreductase-F iron-sulfur binding region domain-containing protein [Chloroflexota bacterium]